MGGGKFVEGEEHSVGAMVGNGDIGKGGTGSQRRRDCPPGLVGSGTSNESVGRNVSWGTGGRGRGPSESSRCG